MPQNGFHGLVGLAVAKGLAHHAPAGAAEVFVAGITLGAMLPDVDIYPAAVFFLAGRPDMVPVIHRTLTHSLLAILVAAGVGAALGRRSPAGRWGCWGLAVGMMTHAFLDAFFWFGQLDLFWPLSHLPRERPLAPVIDLWAAARPLPALLFNLREAFEFAAFALYLRALRRVVQGTVNDMADGARVGKGVPPFAAAVAANGGVRLLARWERWAWIGFAAALVGAFWLPNPLQEVLVYAPWLLAFAPFCWSRTLQFRGAVTAWCLRSEARRGGVSRVTQ
jgi:membrane-bound metal-dependent hydrolase YbcI (DUF457 family)